MRQQTYACSDCGTVTSDPDHCLPCLYRLGVCVSDPEHPNHAAFLRVRRSTAVVQLLADTITIHRSLRYPH